MFGILILTLYNFTFHINKLLYILQAKMIT